MKKTPLLLLSLLSLALPGELLADCKLRLRTNNVNLVWSQTLGTQQLTFQIEKGNAPQCHYGVTFSRGNNSSSGYNRRMQSGSSYLNYQLYRESSLTNILKELPDVTSLNDIIVGTLPHGNDQVATVTYFLQIPLNQATQPRLKPPGTYTDTYVLRVYDNTGNHLTTPDDTKNVNLTTIIPRDIQLSLVAAGGGFDPNSTTQSLDFGTLSDGATRSFDLRVLSNAGFVVTFSSQNNGQMKHENASVTTKVPYTLTVNSVPKNLSSSAGNPVVVATSGGQTDMQGAVNPVTITIGSIEGKLAGRYSDNIVVTAATTE